METKPGAGGQQQCSLRINFDRGEDLNQQEDWVRKKLEAVGLSMTAIQYERVNECSCRLIFPTFEPYARFRYNALGDRKKGRGLSTSCDFEFDGDPNTDWVEATRVFCASKKLSPIVKIEGSIVKFEFDYFREMAVFRIAVQNGEIEQASETEAAGLRLAHKTPVLRPYNPVIS